MPLSPEIVQSVADTNFKNLAEAPAFFTAQLYALSLQNQTAVYQIGQSNLGVILNNLNSYSTSEAKAESQLLTSNVMAEVMTALTAALSNAQQQAKVSQSTPPVTGQ